MKVNFADRRERLSNLTRGLPISTDLPLFKEVPVDLTLFHILKSAVSTFLAASLVAWRGEGVDPKRNLLLEDALGELTRIPNRTPNGSVMAQRENTFEFNLVHRYVSKILRRLKIDDRIEALHLPLIVRLVDGRPDQAVDSRPYATAKLHTDVWNGEPPTALSVFIPTLGDIKEAGVEFFEPDEEEMKKMMRAYSDYNAGAHLLERSYRYDCRWRPGYIYFVDPLLLHRTMKRGGGIRVSIDFRLIPAEKVPSDFLHEDSGVQSNWGRNFISPSEWHAVGEEAAIVPQEAFDDAVRFSSGVRRLRPVNYATFFSRVLFSGKRTGFLRLEEAERYERDGYLVVENVFAPEECDRINAIYHRYASWDFKGIMNLERGGVVEHIDFADDWEIIQRRKVKADDADAVWRMVSDPRMTEMLETLQKAEVVHLQSMLLFKEAGSPYAAQSWNPHQDNAYPEADAGLYITGNIAFADQDEENGCMRIYPGTHRLGTLRPKELVTSFREIPGGRPGHPVEIPEEYNKPVTLYLKKGSALFLNGDVIHDSYPNRSRDRSRPMLLVPYGTRGISKCKGIRGRGFQAGAIARRMEASLRGGHPSWKDAVIPLDQI